VTKVLVGLLLADEFRGEMLVSPVRTQGIAGTSIERAVASSCSAASQKQNRRDP